MAYSLQNQMSTGKDADPWACFRRLQTGKTYEKGQLIYMQDTTADRFYYILSGRVRSFISDSDGNERVLNLYSQGDIFGEASFFDGQPRMSSASALTESRILSIDWESLSRFFAEDPQLPFAMLRYLSNTIRVLSIAMDNVSFRSAHQRIARQLLALSGGRAGRVPCTHEELAHSVGVSRITVSRVLADLAAQGLIRTAYRAVEILEPTRLEHVE